MLKNFLLIILMTLSVVAFNNSQKISIVENEIEEEVEYAPQGSISVSTINETIFNEKHNYYDDLTIQLSAIKNEDSVQYITIDSTSIIGNIDYYFSEPLVYFNNNNSVNFNLFINDISKGNSHIEITITPYYQENNKVLQGESEKINIYFVGEIRYYCITNTSLTNTRYQMANYLIVDGYLLESERNTYIYQEDNEYYIETINIDSITNNELEGCFFIENKNDSNDFCPAEGIKTFLKATYEDDEVIQSNPAYVDENGKFNISFNYTNYEKLELILLAETKYVKMSFNEDDIDNTIYSYTIDLTDIVTTTYGIKYLIDNIYTEFSTEPGKAFAQAVLFNAAGDFADSLITKTIPQVSVVFITSTSSYSKDFLRIKLSGYGHMGAFHEYGHFICHLLGVKQEIGGVSHNDEEDLALRYPDIYKTDETGKDITEYGRGYQAAWGEGFATYFSNLVQHYTDYSHLSNEWEDEYESFQNTDPSSPGFVLRESNERTVTHVLLALTDPDFRGDDSSYDAIGVNRFFNILETYNQNINSLSNLLDLLSEQENMNMDLINETMAFYRLAPYEGKVKYNNVEIGIVHENNIPTFTWYKGSYIFYSEYLTYKDGGFGQRYTEEEAIENPSLKRLNYGLSNNNFTLYLYNQNGGLLLKKENIVDNDISNSTASYTPTKQEWESIFFSNTFYCYWYVEGYDSNNTTNNGSYRYISEEYDIILEKKYISVNTNNTSSGINGMSIDVDLYETYGNEINVRNFDVVIEYNWDTIPTERMQDYIVMRWSTVYQLNDQRYSVDYYNNDIETLRLSSTDFTYNVSSVGMNQIYWRTLLKYKTPENETPTLLYGEAHIGVTSTNSAASLMVTVSYHHTTSMAVGEKGVYMNESGIYTTDATQVETLTKIFTIA